MLQRLRAGTNWITQSRLLDGLFVAAFVLLVFAGWRVRDAIHAEASMDECLATALPSQSGVPGCADSVLRDHGRQVGVTLLVYRATLSAKLHGSTYLPQWCSLFQSASSSRSDRNLLERVEQSVWTTAAEAGQLAQLKAVCGN